MLYNSNDFQMFWLKFMLLHSVYKILMTQGTVEVNTDTVLVLKY
jgi:hypothetical protein